MRAERELRGRNELGPCTDLTTSLDGPIQKISLERWTERSKES